MKIDPVNPRHWLYLAQFGANAVLATVLRWLRGARADGLVLFYGHKLNGNLAAVMEHAATRQSMPGVAFLTMDPEYHRQLVAQGVRSVLATSPSCIALLAGAQAIVTDHGLHALEILARFTRLRLFDVWHGIPFKGFDAADFKVQHRYYEAWVSSPLLATMYVERFGFRPGAVHATGYARTDRLAKPRETRESLLQRFNLASVADRKLVLFAPTWKQDASGRSLFPFNVSAELFLGTLESLCKRTGACLLFRSHLNSGEAKGPPSEFIRFVPHGRFPDTEGLLLVSDALVCDWSSIAFDYLVLDRPTVFLDVPPPFAKGFSLGPEFRFGSVVRDLAGLVAELERSLRDPEAYLAEHGRQHALVLEQVYAGLADGNSSARCVARLEQALASRGSSR